ncbi:hypothetical protein CLF_104305 [Clonorchis sinensis]|uniref:Uncharacterized protein n=1 Tax=Clonorchis sinensis TaxID=79923 RepID=G7YBD1_CLOSI|nr:hypothetical protein CLF_104305 [Clonorchis sinensis]
MASVVFPLIREYRVTRSNKLGNRVIQPSNTDSEGITTLAGKRVFATDLDHPGLFTRTEELRGKSYEYVVSKACALFVASSNRVMLETTPEVFSVNERVHDFDVVIDYYLTARRPKWLEREFTHREGEISSKWRSTFSEIHSFAAWCSRSSCLETSQTRDSTGFQPPCQTHHRVADIIRKHAVFEARDPDA